jgi:hypothetical protein
MQDDFRRVALLTGVSQFSHAGMNDRGQRRENLHRSFALLTKRLGHHCPFVGIAHARTLAGFRERVTGSTCGTLNPTCKFEVGQCVAQNRALGVETIQYRPSFSGASLAAFGQRYTDAPLYDRIGRIVAQYNLSLNERADFFIFDFHLAFLPKGQQPQAVIVQSGLNCSQLENGARLRWPRRVGGKKESGA